MQQGEDSREVSATDLQHCDWCGAGSLTMLKCGKCRLVYAGVLELVRYLGCLPLAIGLASAHAGVHGTARPGEFLAALKRVAPPPPSQLEVGAKVEELHSLNATEHNEKHGKLLEYNAETQCWVVELSEGCSIRVCTLNL